MKQPWWTSALSYLRDVHLESVDSAVNPDLYVCYSRGRYQLCVENAIYSFADKYDNFWDTFEQLDVTELQDKNILILGFGLGSIPFMLEKMGVTAHFTGVEYDEMVTYLFNKYVADDIESPLEIVTADARIFMELNERKYDMIAMDVFVEDLIPDFFLDEYFIEQLRDSLTENGILIWNHLYHFEKDRKQADHFFEKKFKKVFKNGGFIQTKGNKMMLNKNIVPSQ
jgi:spermidine synthase